MYTELYLAFGLISRTSPNVLDVLQYLFNKGPRPETLPDHRFFMCTRWDRIGTGSSHYFIPFSVSQMVYDVVQQSYFIVSLSNLKNYDSEVEHFLDFIMPYIDASPGKHIGHKRYEENDKPTLLYKVE